MHGLFLQKIKKGTSIVDAFKKIITEGQRKPNKIWVDQGSEFYNQSFTVNISLHHQVIKKILKLKLTFLIMQQKKISMILFM